MSPAKLPQFFNASDAFKRLNPALFSDVSIKADNQASTPKLECSAEPKPLAARKAKKADRRFFFIRVTSFRRRLLDEDNLCEKFHVDLCRYVGVLPDDSAAKARIVTTQEKVSRAEEERTEIEIDIVES